MSMSIKKIKKDEILTTLTKGKIVYCIIKNFEREDEDYIENYSWQYCAFFIRETEESICLEKRSQHDPWEVCKGLSFDKLMNNDWYTF